MVGISTCAFATYTDGRALVAAIRSSRTDLLHAVQYCYQESYAEEIDNIQVQCLTPGIELFVRDHSSVA